MDARLRFKADMHIVNKGMIDKRFLSRIILTKGMLLVLLILPGCMTTEQAKQIIPVWPSPPEQPRYIYEGTLRTKGSISSAASEFKELEELDFNKVGEEEGFVKPFDVAAYGGRVVVSDSVARIIHVFDVPHRQMYRIGWGGEGKKNKTAGGGANN